ncbi:MAG: acyl-CoA/acyl-ACP dehydrogenase [Actinomycetia bacterium]|nr:acyl-CoA/acyl-ACP dehydrogenase [Actinomycetes bacterium]
MVDPITFVRSEEQTMLASTVRELVEASATLDSVRDMSLTTDAFNRDVWQGLAEMGLIGLTVPEEYGGAGYGFAEMAVVFEELGRMVTPVPLLSSLLAATAVLESGDHDQKAALLPGIASGETVGSLAAFEAPHCDGVTSIMTSATRSDNGWVISGTKRFVTDAPNVDLFVVTAIADGETGLFAVGSGVRGVTVTATPSLDPTRPLGQVTFDEVLVPAEAYLGGGASSDAVVRAVDVGVAALAQEQVGGAQRCLEMATEYAKTRYQFGRAIGSFQAIKHMCANMLVDVEHSKSAAWHVARTIDDPAESPIAVPLARSVCSDVYLAVAGANIQVHGGIGFTWEHDAHLYFKRAKSTSLLLGPVDRYRDRLAEAIGI